MSDTENLRIKEGSKLICDYIAKHPETVKEVMEKQFIEVAMFLAKSERERRREFNRELLADLRKVEDKEQV